MVLHPLLAKANMGDFYQRGGKADHPSHKKEIRLFQSPVILIIGQDLLLKYLISVKG